MWKSLNNLFNPLIKQQTKFLTAESLLQQQLRTAFVLKRQFPPQLHRKGHRPKTLRSRHYVYDVVKITDFERYPDIEVILTSHVEGVGNKGERVKVRPNYAYNELLLPGKAVYASPENLEKYKDAISNVSKDEHSSATASLTVKTLSKMVLSVVMNKDMPWTLEPWHVKVSFRKSSYVVPEEAITIPRPISGPDLNLEGKEFYVIVTINNLEQVKVRCRLHHWSTDIRDRLQYVPEFWKMPAEPIFEEDRKLLEELAARSDKTT